MNLLIWVRSFSFASVCVWSEFWHMHNNGSEINRTHVVENFKNAILINKKQQSVDTIKKYQNNFSHENSQNYDVYALFPQEYFDDLF